MDNPDYYLEHQDWKQVIVKKKKKVIKTPMLKRD